jgi:hypothetical protein
MFLYPTKCALTGVGRKATRMAFTTLPSTPSSIQPGQAAKVEELSVLFQKTC